MGWASCPAGFVADPLGGCREIAASACPTGTMPLLGREDCVPVGQGPCAAGFEPTAWGCRDAVPATACAGATREAVGAKGCVPVGDCAAPFPPPGATHFVKASWTAAELDATHFKTLGEALAAAPEGAVIAVHEGTYDESLAAARPVTVVGLCPEKVRLDGAARQRPSFKVSGVQGVVLRGLTAAGGQGILAEAGGELTIEDVVLESPRLDGFRADGKGTRLVVRRSVSRNVTSNSIGAFGFGMSAEEGAALEVEDSAVVAPDNTGIAVAATGADPSDAVIRRAVVRDVNARGKLADGAGIWVMGRSRAALEGSVVLGVRRLGFLVSEQGSTLTAKDCVVRDSLPDGSDQLAAGLMVVDGATASVEGVTFLGNAQGGAIGARGGFLRVKGSTFRETQPGADGEFGTGIALQTGARAELDSVALVANSYYGLEVDGVGAELIGRRVLVRDTQPNALGGLGRGLNVDAGGRVELFEATFQGNTDETVLVNGAGPGGERSLVHLSRLLIRDTRFRRGGLSGIGIDVARGAQLLLEDAAIVGAHEGALVVDASSASSLASAVVSNLVVRDTQIAPNDEVGAAVIGGGNLTVSGGAFYGSKAFAALWGGAGRLTLKDVTIRDTQPVPVEGYGHGIAAVGGALLTLERVDVSGSQVGLAVEHSGALVSASLFHHNRTGMLAQRGTAISVVAELPDQHEPLGLVVREDTQLLENDVRVGLDAVPLPASPLKRP